jgi:hypothetical protein
VDGDEMTCTTHHNACDCRQRAIDANIGRLLLNDLRYSMGRCSTAPHSCSEGIRQLWHMCDAAHRRFMLRDLREQFEMWERTDRQCPGVLGDDCDVQTWSELLAWMKEQR